MRTSDLVLARASSRARRSRSADLATAALILLLAGGIASAAETGLRLHPDNPHYFLWRNKPTILITSGEHYGAVLNQDFDYIKYLDTLARDRLNLTRTFAGGAYYEPGGAFNIAQNTLAPRADRFVSPWLRVEAPAGSGAGPRFDLANWNEAYFARLRDFVQKAGERGVVVEMNLFCPFYEESQWKISPFNAANNINGLGQIARTNVYTLDAHGGLLPIQERMVRRFVEELRPFDNVYYEICNEPYFGGVTLEWQQHIAAVIAQAQAGDQLPKLISQNIANHTAKVDLPSAHVSILNFHYASPPEAVAANYQLNRVIGDNETGFRGTNDAPYLTEAWEFILAGGGLYNNLDYSFTAGHEDGTFVYPASQPGGGNPLFRRHLSQLARFMSGFDFVKMKPDPGCLKSRTPANLIVQVLSEPGKAYAVYLRRPAAASNQPGPVFELNLPRGSYRINWSDPKTGASAKTEVVTHEGGLRRLTAPPVESEMALSILAP